MGRLGGRTRPWESPQAGQTRRNLRLKRRPSKGSRWVRSSPPMPRSTHARRHSGPCGAIRRRPDLCWARRCASSWRRVCSTSSPGTSRSAGLSQTSFLVTSATPAVVLMQGFHPTMTEEARAGASGESKAAAWDSRPASRLFRETRGERCFRGSPLPASPFLSPSPPVRKSIICRNKPLTT